MATALVVGGTGPTGPAIVEGLVQRRYETSVLHRGKHEEAVLPSEVAHIHADPFDRASFADAIDGRTFDVVVSSYGRLRMIGEVLTGRAGHVVAVGGMPIYRGWFAPGRNFPPGFTVPVRESFPHATDPAEGEHSFRVARAEAEFLDRVAAGAFTGCVMRYPLIYGPRQLYPREWSIVRRIIDGRRVFLLPDSGLALYSRGYVLNMAHAVLMAVDHPEVAGGRGFNCADEDCLSWAQVVQVIAHALEVEVEILSTPFLPGHPSSIIIGSRNDHRVIDITEIMQDLGYRDVISAVEAMTLTARWYRDHPLQPDDEQERSLQDPFDYALEDTIIERTRRHHDDLGALFGEPVMFTYGYDEKTAPTPFDSLQGVKNS